MLTYFFDSRADRSSFEVRDMVEITHFYGFTVSMDNTFNGTPCICIDYPEDGIMGRFDIEKEEFIDGDFKESMKRIIIEWIDDHIQTLRAMWNERTITILPEWE